MTPQEVIEKFSRWRAEAAKGRVILISIEEFRAAIVALGFAHDPADERGVVVVVGGWPRFEVLLPDLVTPVGAIEVRCGLVRFRGAEALVNYLMANWGANFNP